MILKSHQQNGVSKLNYLKVGALFMEQGSGKTATAYQIIQSANNIDSVVWLTPFQTKENLKLEIELCGGLDNLEIVGIETLSSSTRIYLDLLAKVQSENVFLVLDESIKIKNSDAKRTKRILELSKYCTYKILLNGSPLTRDLLDLWTQMEFLSHKILNMSYNQFRNTFCEYYSITKKYCPKPTNFRYIVKYHNLDYLQSLIEPYVYSCDFDLQIRTQFHELTYDLEESELLDYEKIKQNLLSLENLGKINNNVFLLLTQKLQHSYCLSQSKFGLLDMIQERHDRNKILVYCKFIKSQNAVKERFPHLKVKSYGKHSFGLNLQENNVMIFFDKTFDYAQREQSIKRINRIKQTQDCYYYDFTANTKLDEMIDKNIQKKITMSEYFKQKCLKDIINEL